MTECSEQQGPAAALFRMLAARLDLSAFGIGLVGRDGMRLWAATDAFRAQSPLLRSSVPEPLPEAIRASLAGGATRLPPETIDPECRFAAMVPIAGADGPAGFLLALDRRRRWLGPRAAADLGEAARLLAALLPAAPGPRPEPGTHAATLPRAETHRLIAEAQGGGAGEGLTALLLLDLDRFRSFNEALGAAAGDTLLALTGTRLACAMAAGDRLARIEGDRFLVVTDRARADLPGFAAGLLQTVSEPLMLNGQHVTLQASIGIVAADRRRAAPVLLMQADMALRRAKTDGRNRFVMHGPRLDATASEASRLEIELGEAMSAGQMRLAYQPYVDLAGGDVTGCEALLRWRHPERGDLLPAMFVPLAEASGQILALGSWALTRAIRAAARWPTPLRLSVNISALQFHQRDFTAQVDAALAGTDFPAERLELEITETVLMRDNPETVATLRTLIARGVRIALDDFGTGYSALAYLARLPHHRIKLDRTFVQDLANPATAELIRAIVASARAQGIAVTAEGVETAEQLEAVRRMGFTHAQGFATGAAVEDPAALVTRQPQATPA